MRIFRHLPNVRASAGSLLQRGNRVGQTWARGRKRPEIGWEILGKTGTDSLRRILKKAGEHGTDEKASLEWSTLLPYDEGRASAAALPGVL
ncbi:MAG: hypothetical protein HUU15_10610 [Candidatus Brocadiae bacterium]|nr:hypothetical protein [Candidatus Brocadiia bacterium]